ncbi:MAG: hypothetical protein U0892_06350 [Pirellulales bacterium]
MSVSTIRPRVAELTFQVFGRSLHPELFQVYKSHQIERSNFSAQIDITHDGHRVTWTSETVTLTEVAASARQLLPQRRRLAAHNLNTAGSDRIAYHLGVDYRYEYAGTCACGDVLDDSATARQ